MSSWKRLSALDGGGRFWPGLARLEVRPEAAGPGRRELGVQGAGQQAERILSSPWQKQNAIQNGQPPDSDGCPPSLLPISTPIFHNCVEEREGSRAGGSGR